MIITRRENGRKMTYVPLWDLKYLLYRGEPLPFEIPINVYDACMNTTPLEQQTRYVKFVGSDKARYFKHVPGVANYNDYKDLSLKQIWEKYQIINAEETTINTFDSNKHLLDSICLILKLRSKEIDPGNIKLLEEEKPIEKNLTAKINKWQGAPKVKQLTLSIVG